MTDRILHERYEILQQLGKRPGRETLLARDLQSSNLVVVKLLKFSSELEWDDFKLFEREAQTLKNLSHPAIPQYLDYFEFEAPQYKGFALVQTHLDAKSLETHRQNGRTFSEEEVKEIAEQVLEILSYLHERYPPIIHRDIKPSNILLGDRSAHSVGRVYLVDFGAVQNVAATQGGTFTVVGTYGYMPPEQFGGRGVPASDVYSLGATLIFLLTGKHPADLPQQNLRIQFEDVTSLSSQFKTWLRLAIEPSIEQRLSSAKNALTALKQPILEDAIVSKASSGNLKIASQPAGSKVKLFKNESQLEIVIPPKGFHSGLIPVIGFAFIWNLFLVNWYRIALTSFGSGGWFMGLFSIGHLGVGVWLIWQIVLTLFGESKLSITEEQISLTRKIFNFKYRVTRPALRQDISAIEFSCFAKVNHFSKTTNRRNSTYQMAPHIKILAGTTKFDIGLGYLFASPSSPLTEPEVEWLAQELSHCLNLPISRK